MNDNVVELFESDDLFNEKLEVLLPALSVFSFRTKSIESMIKVFPKSNRMTQKRVIKHLIAFHLDIQRLDRKIGYRLIKLSEKGKE